MSLEEANTIRAAVEYLLKSDRNHNNSFGIVYWYEGNEQEIPDIIGNTIKAQEILNSARTERALERDYTSLLDVIFGNGQLIPARRNRRYHIMHFSVPSKGRIYFTDEKSGTYGEVYKNVLSWYADTRLERSRWDDNSKKQVFSSPSIYNIYSVLLQTLDHIKSTDSDKVRKEHGIHVNELLSSILEDKQIPRDLIIRALRQFNRTIINPDVCKIEDEGRNQTILLQILKLYMLRTKEEVNYMTPSLNENSSNIGYNCGRLFALFCKAQRVSAGRNLNVAMDRRYYAAFKKNPAKTFALIDDNWPVYMNRLKTVGSRAYYNSLKSEIEALIGDSLPTKLSITEQAAFAIGYDQQCQAFYKKNANNTDEDDQSEDSKG